VSDKYEAPKLFELDATKLSPELVERFQKKCLQLRGQAARELVGSNKPGVVRVRKTA